MMLSDFLFKSAGTLSASDYRLIDEYEGSYSEEHDTFRIGISDSGDTAQHIQDIQDFVKELSQRHKDFLDRISDKRVMITATIPADDRISRRVYFTSDIMRLLLNNNIDLDYEVGLSCDE